MLGPMFLLAGGILLAGPILALIALARSNRNAVGRTEELSELSRRIESLEKHLAVMGRRVASLESAAAPAGPATAFSGASPVSPAAPPSPVAPSPSTILATPHARAADLEFDLPAEPPVVAPQRPAPSPGAQPASAPFAPIPSTTAPRRWDSPCIRSRASARRGLGQAGLRRGARAPRWTGAPYAGPIEANPLYSLHARLKGSGLRQTVLLWTALVAAVVVLALLTLRLARRAPTAST